MALRYAPSVMAGRQAEDVGRVRAEVANAGPGQRFQTVRVRTLLGEDRPLVRWAAERVLADHPVAPDDPVARDDERHGVVAERRADGADGPGPADLCRDPAVRTDLAAGDLEGLQPDGALERRRAAEIEIDLVAPVAGQSALDPPGEVRGERLAATRDPAGPGEE